MDCIYPTNIKVIPRKPKNPYAIFKTNLTVEQVLNIVQNSNDKPPIGEKLAWEFRIETRLENDNSFYFAEKVRSRGGFYYIWSCLGKVISYNNSCIIISYFENNPLSLALNLFMAVVSFFLCVFVFDNKNMLSALFFLFALSSALAYWSYLRIEGKKENMVKMFTTLFEATEVKILKK